MLCTQDLTSSDKEDCFSVYSNRGCRLQPYGRSYVTRFCPYFFNCSFDFLRLSNWPESGLPGLGASFFSFGGVFPDLPF